MPVPPCCRPSAGRWIVMIVALLAATASADAQPPAAAEPPPLFEVAVSGRGTPMVLVPGLMSHGALWDDVVAHYRGRHELHVLTLAGFAGVPPVDSAAAPRFLEAQRDAIIRYVRERRLERPVLVGHSLGAFLALAVAAEAPELVGPVVAVDGVPFLMTLGDTTMTVERARPGAAMARAAYAALEPAQVGAQSRAAMAGMTADTVRAATAAAWSGRSHPPTVGRAVAEMMTTDLRGAVAAIRTPVLLVAAGAHAATDEARAGIARAYERQVAQVPDAHVVVAARARHFVMWDDLPFLLSTMDAFLADAAGRPAGGGR